MLKPNRRWSVCAIGIEAHKSLQSPYFDLFGRIDTELLFKSILLFSMRLDGTEAHIHLKRTLFTLIQDF